jgi:hypothetical protein
MFNFSVATWATALKNRGPDKYYGALGYWTVVKFLCPRDEESGWGAY